MIIRPAIVGHLARVRAHYDSLYGRIVSEWRRDSNRLSLHVAIPPNSTATAYVPAADARSVLEGGKLATQSLGVAFVRSARAAAISQVGSGDYTFTGELPTAKSP